MPKKFGTNTKSAEARAKKEELKQADKHQKERAAQDALWIDDDKHIARKQQRKVPSLSVDLLQSDYGNWLCRTDSSRPCNHATLMDSRSLQCHVIEAGAARSLQDVPIIQCALHTRPFGIFSSGLFHF